jgi:hypothetical protein
MYVAHMQETRPSSRTVYIGRATQNRPASPLANPFPWRGDSPTERAVVRRQDRRWLWTQIQEGQAHVIEALRSLKADSVLVCSCAPKLCHGHVIMNAWAWGVRQGWIDPCVYANHDASTLGRVAEAGAAQLAQAAHAEWQETQRAASATPAQAPTRKARRAQAAKRQRDLAASAQTLAALGACAVRAA